MCLFLWVEHKHHVEIINIVSKKENTNKQTNFLHIKSKIPGPWRFHGWPRRLHYQHWGTRSRLWPLCWSPNRNFLHRPVEREPGHRLPDPIFHVQSHYDWLGTIEGAWRTEFHKCELLKLPAVTIWCWLKGKPLPFYNGQQIELTKTRELSFLIDRLIFFS